MFTKLLVPLDGSSLAEQALARASTIARASNAEITLVLVHESVPDKGVYSGDRDAERWNRAHRYVESIATEVAHAGSVTVSHSLRRGDPIASICRCAADLDADLIVMTSHGRTGVSRAWLGSVADGVLRHAKVPVLMLPPVDGMTWKSARARSFARVLVPMDDSAFSAEMLGAAIALAKSADARLTLLRVVQPVAELTPDGFDYVPALVDGMTTRHLADEAMAELEAVSRRLAQEWGVAVDADVVVDAHVAPAILTFAKTRDIDVIAMATHGRGASRLLVGSVADKVLRGSGTPMLLYRPAAVAEKGKRAATSAETMAHA